MSTHCAKTFIRLLLTTSAFISTILIAETAFADPISGTVFNNTTYSQTSDSAPTTPSGYFFSIGADQTAGDYASAVGTYPGVGSPQTLPAYSSTGFAYSSPFFASAADLQASYPFGNYSVTASNGGTSTTATVAYAGNYFTSSIPYLTNYSALQGLNAGAGFTVTYDAFTPDPASTEGFTFLTIYNATTDAVVYSDGFQNPGSTSAFIAGGTLSPGTAYIYEIDYSDRIDGISGLNFTEQGFDVRTDGFFTTGVPEASTWAMMLIGFAGLGFSARRFRKSHDIAVSAI